MTREQVNTQVQNLLIPLVEVSNHLESNQVMLNYLDQEIARLLKILMELYCSILQIITQRHRPTLFFLGRLI
jgi:hypothetical protein